MRLERRKAAMWSLLAALLLGACDGSPTTGGAIGGPATPLGTAPPPTDPASPPVPVTPSDPPTQADPPTTPPPPVETPTPPVPTSAPLTTTVVASGLEAPWSLAFLPDGTALVSERDSGRVLSIDAGGGVNEVRRLPSAGRGEGGLLGLAVSPAFASDGLVYAYYSTPRDNRIVRFRLAGGVEAELILTGIPVGRIHNGGRLAFGPEGLLYATTGDSSERSLAQNPGSLGGKILRLTPDGGVPEGNPFPGSLVYSLGHRNVQGLAWTADGQLYATEFGQNTYDEVNRIVPGGNYGWPAVEGPGGAPDYREPVTVFSTAEASPSGATALVGGAIPQWEGDVFLAGLRGRRLWRLRLAPDGTLLQREPLLQGEAGRLRAVTQAPDGSLWILTSNRDGRGNPADDDDRILRLGPPN